MTDEKNFKCLPNALGNMSKQNGKTSALFFATVYAGFLCLLLIACGIDGVTDDMHGSAQNSDIDPDKFTLDVEDSGTRINNFVTIKIIPGSPGMRADEFFITASIANENGIVKGAVDKENNEKGSRYTAELDDCSVATLACTILKPKRENQGSPIKFKVNVMPNATIKKEDLYTLNLKIEHKASNSHTETCHKTLKSRIHGENQQTQTRKSSISNKSPQTPTAVPSTTSDDTIQSINCPILNDDLPILTEVASTIYTNPQILVSNTDLPTTSNSGILNTNARQSTYQTDNATEEKRTPTLDVVPMANAPTTPAGRAQSLGGCPRPRRLFPDPDLPATPNSATPNANARLCIKDSSTNKNNFVAVEIIPDSPDVHLEDFFVTASIVGSSGIMKGAKHKKGGGGRPDYTVDLNDCNVTALSCTPLKAKQSNQGSPIKFRVKIIPGEAIKQGNQYTLNITIEHKGDNPYTATQNTELIAKRDSKDPQAPKKVHAPIVNVQAPENYGTVTPQEGSSNDTDTSCQAPNSNTFAVTLTDGTISRSIRNFVLVTVQPSDKGMTLDDFSVTATLSDNGGTVRGIHDKKGINNKKSGSFIYDKKLDNCNLASLFLVDNASCLDANNTSFAEGKAISFKIEAKPGAGSRQGQQYTLTIEIKCTGDNPHTERKSITLTATKTSAVKRRKHISTHK